MNPLDKTNLWLLLTVICLALVAWIKPGMEPLPQPALTNMDPQQIRQIKLYHNDRIRLVLSRNESGWQMTQPVIGQAEEERIKKLTQLVMLPSQRRFDVPVQRLHEFGLESPQYRLQLNDREFNFGDIDPVTKQRYVLVNGTVHVITDGFTAYLLAKPQEYLVAP